MYRDFLDFLYRKTSFLGSYIMYMIPSKRFPYLQEGLFRPFLEDIPHVFHKQRTLNLYF